MYLKYSTLCFFAFQLAGITHSIPHFKRQSFFEHFKTVCTNSQIKTVIILIDFQSSKRSSTNKIASILSNLKCPFIRPSTINTFTGLHLFLNSDGAIKYKKKMLVFDYTAISEQHFPSIVKNLAEFYENCYYCLPSTVVVNFPITNLYKLTTNLFLKLPKYFQSCFLTMENDEYLFNLYVNPILDGCAFYPGLFSPTSSADISRLNTPIKLCDLNNSTLNVSVNDWFPSCGIKRVNKQIVVNFNSIEMQFLKVLEEKYHFNSHFIDGNQQWGKKENGTWTGIVAQVQNGTSHFAMCSISETEERKEVVDFTHYLFLDTLSFASRSPGPTSRALLFANSFALSTWLTLCLTFVFLSAILSYITHRQGENETIGDIATHLLAITLNQSTNVKYRISPTSLRLIYASWMLSVFILSNVYSSTFFSSLSIPNYDRPIDTLKDLHYAAKHDSKYILVLFDSTFYTRFVYSKPGISRTYTIIGQHINRTKQKMFVHPTDQITWIDADPKKIAIADRLYFVANRRRKAHHLLHIGSENIENDYIAVMLRKRSPLRKAFNLIIGRCRETGLFEFWLRQTGTPNLYENPHSSKRGPSNVRTLTLRDLQSVFCLWFATICLSMGGFLCQLLALKMYTFWNLKEIEKKT